MKNIIVYTLCLATLFAFTGCNNKDTTTTAKSSASTTSSEEISPGYTTSEEVVRAFWKGYDTADSNLIRSVLPPEELAASYMKVDELVEEYHTKATEKSYGNIDYDSISIDTRPYNVTNIDYTYTDNYNITDANRSKVTVTSDNAETTYEIITANIDGLWYMLSIDTIDQYEIDADTGEFNDDSLTVNTNASKLDNYNKIKWSDTFTLDKYKGIEVSIANTAGSADDYGCVVIGITNNYEESISFSGMIRGIDKDNNEVGVSYVSTDVIESGNTGITLLYYAENVPDKYEFEGISINTFDYTPIKFNTTTNLFLENDMLNLEYTITTENPAMCSAMTALLVDKDGTVIGSMIDYPGEINNEFIMTINTYSGQLSEQEAYEQTKDVVIFTNLTN